MIRRAYKDQRGVTLVELVISIVVISIAAVILIQTLSMTYERSADPMVRHQAVAIAEAYLEEIQLRDFNDPDGIDGEGARAAFDDVDDYDGLVDVGARDQFGVPIADLDDYTVSVSVSGSGALPGIPAARALRIDVLVTRAPDIQMAVSAYRTDF